ncbi:MAG: DNA repair protein RadA [Acidimicrobiia bacterium]|nr:DNA repair protein RadA [Acidimicrobiia bacterium]
MNGSAGTEKSTYACEACGYRSPKWMGFCPQCRGGALAETAEPNRKGGRRVPPSLVSVADPAPAEPDRTAVGIGEIDRVLGGGLVRGAVVLVGGEPGVGKSTLLLQAAAAVAGSVGTVMIATAEESARQVQMRAGRVGVADPGVTIASVGDVDDIVALAADHRPAVLVVDSIQTVSSTEVSGSAGGVAQVRDSAARLIAYAKTSGTPVVLVGHVTKDGSIAGPRTLEHMVDVVLYLEGESDVGLRFLRSIKNRFGSVNEVGVFEMTASGLVEVPDPSGLLVANRDDTRPGSVLFPTIEGKRPMVVEIQALVVDSEATQPRRSVTGLPASRVHQVLGVLDRHGRIAVRGKEVYVSVMGGIRVVEPAADLAVALAVASAVQDVSLGKTAAWGELGLTGDVRPVSRPALRSGEVARISAGPVLAPSEGHTRIEEALQAAAIPTGSSSAPPF